jgi:sulfatase modifying factor 1
VKQTIGFLVGLVALSIHAQTPAPEVAGAKDNSVGIEFVFIPGGTFEMGDVFGDGRPDEKPVHLVTLSDFYLGQTEVTVSQYNAFCKATRRKMPLAPDWGWQDDRPIVNVNWDDAMAFCEWAGCRLPTEAEWEYGARNRGELILYSWGNDPPDSTLGGNVADESARKGNPRMAVFAGYDDGCVQTAATASFSPNSLGLYDMTGNVWEWCADWYGDYSEAPATNPKGPESGAYRVLRGGSWINDPASSRTTTRFKNKPTIWFECYGFRVAR